MLRRAFKNEEVLITVDLEAQKALSSLEQFAGDDDDDEGEEMEGEKAVTFTVSILKENAGKFFLYLMQHRDSWNIGFSMSIGRHTLFVHMRACMVD